MRLVVDTAARVEGAPRDQVAQMVALASAPNPAYVAAKKAGRWTRGIDEALCLARVAEGVPFAHPIWGAKKAGGGRRRGVGDLARVNRQSPGPKHLQKTSGGPEKRPREKPKGGMVALNTT